MRKLLHYFILLFIPFTLPAQINNSFSAGNINLSLPNPGTNLGEYNIDSANDECFQEYTGNYFGALLIMNTGSSMWMAANDINVEANTEFNLETIEFDVVTTEGLPTTFNIGIYNNNLSGGPGSQIGMLLTDLLPNSVVPNGTWGQSGYQIYKVVIPLTDAPLLQATLTESKKYWIGISGNPTTEESYFIYLASALYQQNSNSSPTWISDGSVWLEYVDAGNRAEGILKISGSCEPLQGCTNTPNGKFPLQTFIPSCNGFVEIIAEGITGQYSSVQVSDGTKYIFSSSESSDFITITDEESTILAVGLGSVDWTADFNGIINFYTHLNNNCDFDNQNTRLRKVHCGIPECDMQEIASNDFQNGVLFGGIMDQSLAFDIPVGEIGFSLYGVELNVIRNNQNGDNITFNSGLYDEMNGVPGNLLNIDATTIVNSDYLGSVVFNSTNFDIYRYLLKFENPVSLSAFTKYWLEIEALGGIGDVFWETNPDFVLSSGIALSSLPTGYNWALDSSQDLVYKLICDEILDLNDMNSSEFSFYPNPVKNILNITSERTIEHIEVYNFNGQAVLKKLNPVNKQIDIQSLSSGAYLFKIVLEGGQIETFKILKN